MWVEVQLLRDFRQKCYFCFCYLFLLLSLGAISNFVCKCTGGWHFLLDIIACCTTSSVHGSAAGSSARNYPSLTFRSFNSGAPPGDGAVTGMSACHTLQLIAVTHCGCWMGLGVLSPTSVLPPQPEPKAAFPTLLCQIFCGLSLLRSSHFCVP